MGIYKNGPTKLHISSYKNKRGIRRKIVIHIKDDSSAVVVVLKPEGVPALTANTGANKRRDAYIKMSHVSPSVASRHLAFTSYHYHHSTFSRMVYEKKKKKWLKL